MHFHFVFDFGRKRGGKGLLKKHIEIINNMEVEVKNQKTTPHNQNVTLSFEQIKDIVGNGWALIKDPVFNGCIFVKGELIYHSQNEDAAYEEFRVTKEKDVLIKYCGERDPKIVYLL